MTHRDQLQQPSIYTSERLVVESGLVRINDQDPRTRPQFIEDTLETLLVESPLITEGFDIANISGFDIERPADGRTLDGAIAIGLKSFFVKHTDVVKTKAGYDFKVHDYPLDPVYLAAKDLLETGYGVTDYLGQSLPGPAHAREWGANKRRWTLAHACLLATKRALLENRLRNAPGNLFARNSEQKAVIKALESYPPISLEHLARQ